MSFHDDGSQEDGRDGNDLLAALAKLPAPAQSPAGQAATWERAAGALRATRPRGPAALVSWPLWRSGGLAFIAAHFVPATLVLAGALYAGGAVRQLDQIFGVARRQGKGMSVWVPMRGAPTRAL